MIGETQAIARRNLVRIGSRELRKELRLGGVLALLPAHQMAVQFDIEARRQSLQRLCRKTAVTLINLMEIIDPMRGRGFDAGLLGLPVPRCDGRSPGNSCHQTGGQPAGQVAGVHGGNTTLILKLLGQWAYLSSTR